jgi:hypothetical protein
MAPSRGNKKLKEYPMISEEIKRAFEAIGTNTAVESMKNLSESVLNIRSSAKRHWLDATTITLRVTDAHKTLVQLSLELTEINITAVQRSWLGCANETTRALSEMSDNLLRANWSGFLCK